MGGWTGTPNYDAGELSFVVVSPRSKDEKGGSSSPYLLISLAIT